MSQILNIAGYKFIGLTDLSQIQTTWLQKSQELALKGTILLSTEGVNINLAGLPDKVSAFLSQLTSDNRFNDMSFRESYSDFQPFRYMKVKIKKEIITLRQSEICPAEGAANAISPEEFKKWYDEKREMVVLDTRNDYEFRFGTFQDAVNLHLNEFGKFPKVLEQIGHDKPIVMFCTGGIRCEKAGLVMLKKGFKEVYQLQGGILNYFAKVGSAYFNGECFVFDQRVAVDSQLRPTGTLQCRICQGPIPNGMKEENILEQSCPTCINHLT